MHGTNANALNPFTLGGTPSPFPLPQVGGEGGVRGLSGKKLNAFVYVIEFKGNTWIK